MVQRIAEPANVNPATMDWQQLLNKLTATCGHLREVDFVGDGTIAPQIKAGSRFEVSGSFFVILSGDEAIIGFDDIDS